MAAESRTAVIAALLGNAALAVLKGVAAAFTGSAALLAETFHSIADTGNQALLMLGMRLGGAPPDRRHPFGHGNNVYFWAFVVAMMLFSLGGAFAIWEAVRRFLHPVAHAGGVWGWAVLGGAFAFESVSLGVALHSLRAAKGRRSALAYFRDTRDPTLITVVMEDSAALVSILVAAGGLGLSQLTGDAVWDGVASLVIGLLLVGVAIVLAVESYSLLLGERAPADVEARIRRAVESHPAVARIAALDTLHVGPEFVLVGLAVVFRDGMAAERLISAVREVEGRARQALQGTGRREAIFVEPRAAEDPVARAA
jgi:cation diffusion facilitator family transporter